MKKGSIVNYTAPNSTRVYRGKVVARHETHNGDWLEIAPVDEAGKIIKGSVTQRVRPGRCV